MPRVLLGNRSSEVVRGMGSRTEYADEENFYFETETAQVFLVHEHVANGLDGKLEPTQSTQKVYSERIISLDQLPQMFRPRYEELLARHQSRP